jgi:hypothetical protein
MTNDERWAWTRAVFDHFIAATLDYRHADWEFYSLWYTDLFNKGRRF